MIRKIAKNIFSLNKFAKPAFRSIFSAQKTRPYLKIATFVALPLWMYGNSICCYAHKKEEEEQKISEYLPKIDPTLVENPTTLWEKIKVTLAHILRFFQLIFIFMPSIITFPLKLFKRTEKLWLKIFVSAVENAGVVWIKAFQYLSHRRDVIGPEMAQSFSHLRQNAPQHSFQQTKRNFKLKHGKQIDEIFDQFDTVPIASGSVSQVYKAIYKGKKVAVKVRHPQVDKYIQRDVNILFGISRFLAFFSKAYQIPIGQESLKKTLIDQIDFNIQKDNLNTFNRQFLGNKSVKFPTAFDKETRDSILIESFAEGVPVTYFENNRHPLNAVIARLGATTFFEMLMKNNFVHADCHGGNILVEITKQSSTFFGQIWEFIKQKFQQVQSKVMEQFMENETLRSLYKSSREEQKRIRDMIRRCTDKVKIHLIDVGMVIKLQEIDRLNFVNFIKSIIQGNSEKCATMIYNLSNFQGKKILDGKYSEYKSQLSGLFSILDNKSIFDIEGIELLISMLNIIRENNMKLDGEFATLITNMVVLESIAKEIDPGIQILKCAVPYFKFVDKPAERINTLLI